MNFDAYSHTSLCGLTLVSGSPWLPLGYDETLDGEAIAQTYLQGLLIPFSFDDSILNVGNFSAQFCLSFFRLNTS